MENTGIYCYQLMKGISINPAGSVRPCCAIQVPETNAPGSRYSVINYSTCKIGEFLNLDLLTTMRTDLKNGIKSKYCDTCWSAENAGRTSIRQSHNADKANLTPDNKWDDVTNDGQIDSSSITYLDLSLGNTCNLKCRSCNVYGSKQWIDEAEHYLTNYLSDHAADTIANAKGIAQNPWYVEKFKSDFFDDVLPSVRHINFLGGEPLIVTEHYAFLLYIIENNWAEHITLSYNTNGTVLPDKLLEIWKHFAGVNLGISIDAINDLAYYVRYPSNWKTINDNVYKLIQYAKEQKHIQIQIHTTLSMLNIGNLQEVIDWSVNLYNIGNFYNEDTNQCYGMVNALPHLNIVDDPQYLHISNLPDSVRPMVIKHLSGIFQKYKTSGIIPEWNVSKLHEIQTLISIIETPQNKEEWQRFINITKESDAYRNVNIVDYIPWMKTFI